jgi:hypothetical protein
MNYILHDDYWIIKTFDTLQGAKTSLTRKWKAKYPNAVVVDSKTFYENEPMVERTNIMSGEKYVERKSTPLCCSPSSELYWSM